jgi:protein-tyrosine phosphatase
MSFDQILPEIFVGTCPTTVEDIDDLRHEAGITAVLSLQTAEDFAYYAIDWNELGARYRELNIEVRRVPVLDFNPGDLRRNLPECTRTLDELLRTGHVVYVHCNAGVNRSPTTVIAYLHWIERWDLGAAVEHVRDRRLCDPYVEAIRLATEDRRRNGLDGF